MSKDFSSVSIPHASIFLIYFWMFLWGILLITGFSYSYSNVVSGWEHEFRIASLLNLLLLILSIILIFTSVCKTTRSKQMLLWFFHYELNAPIFLVMIYFIDKYDWRSEYVFYYGFFFLAVPLCAFVYLTASALSMFVYT